MREVSELTQQRQDDPQQPASPETPASQAAPETQTRRAVLRSGGRKALYVAPVILTLSAQKALAGDTSAFTCGSLYKHTVGSPCGDTAGGAQCCPPLTCDSMTNTCVE